MGPGAACKILLRRSSLAAEYVVRWLPSQCCFDGFEVNAPSKLMSQTWPNQTRRNKPGIVIFGVAVFPCEL